MAGQVRMIWNSLDGALDRVSACVLINAIFKSELIPNGF